MREFIKSIISFSWGMSLFGVKQLENILTSEDASQPQNKVATAFDAVTHATEEQLDGVIREAFQAGDRWQRDMMDMMFSVLPRLSPPPLMQASSEPARALAACTIRHMHPAPTIRVDSGRLNTTTFITLGEGLAAGMGILRCLRTHRERAFRPKWLGKCKLNSSNH